MCKTERTLLMEVTLIKSSIEFENRRRNNETSDRYS